MGCKKARTYYMLMVDYTVMDEYDPQDHMIVRTPVLRNPPGFDPMDMVTDSDLMEASCYITREDAESHRQQWADRFPHATYSIMEITPR